MLARAWPSLVACTQIFKASSGGFIIAFFPVCILGAIIGKLMDDSGSANAIAKLGPERAIVAATIRPDESHPDHRPNLRR